MKLQRNRKPSFVTPVEGLTPRKKLASSKANPVKNPGGGKGLAKGTSNYQRSKR